MPAITPDPNAPLYIVLNAGSGSSETEVRRSTIEDVLTQAGRTYHLFMVDQPDQLAEIARDAVAKAKAAGGIVVAAGGDGTINTVARETVASGCMFGVLPQGTFNYFGRTHNIPEDLGDAVRALLTARVHPVQIGLVNDRIFLVNASIGLYPTLLEEREVDKKQYGRSRFIALVSGLKTVFSVHKHMRITLDLNGKEHALRTPTLFIGNNRLQMEQLGIGSLSEAVEDGELAAMAPKIVGKLGMLGLIVRAMLGRLDDADDLVRFSFRRLTVRPWRFYGRRRIKVAVDGEVIQMHTPLAFCVLDGQLLLLKPDPGAQPEAPSTRERNDAVASD